MKINILKLFVQLLSGTLPIIALIYEVYVERNQGYIRSSFNDVIFISSFACMIGVFLISLNVFVRNKSTIGTIVSIILVFVIITALISISLFQLFITKLSSTFQDGIMFSLVSLIIVSAILSIHPLVKSNSKK